MLSLRALTLTDAEKRAVRGTDPRAAEMLDRVEKLPPDLMDRLHGAIRYLVEHREGRAPRPPTGLGRRRRGTGMRGKQGAAAPRLRGGPTPRTSSSRAARPRGRVMHDVDGRDHLAVLLDDDPGLDLAVVHGRYLFFAPTRSSRSGVRGARPAPRRVLVAGVGQHLPERRRLRHGVVAWLAERAAQWPDWFGCTTTGSRRPPRLRPARRVRRPRPRRRDAATGGAPGRSTSSSQPPTRPGRRASAHGRRARPGPRGGAGPRPGPRRDRLRPVTVVGCEPASTEDGMGLTDVVAGAGPGGRAADRRRPGTGAVRLREDDFHRGRRGHTGRREGDDHGKVVSYLGLALLAAAIVAAIPGPQALPRDAADVSRRCASGWPAGWSGHPDEPDLMDVEVAGAVRPIHVALLDGPLAAG